MFPGVRPGRDVVSGWGTEGGAVAGGGSGRRSHATGRRLRRRRGGRAARRRTRPMRRSTWPATAARSWLWPKTTEKECASGQVNAAHRAGRHRRDVPRPRRRTCHRRRSCRPRGSSPSGGGARRPGGAPSLRPIALARAQQLVGVRRAVAGAHELARIGVVEQTEVRTGDQLTLLPLPECLESAGAAELVLPRRGPGRGRRCSGRRNARSGG